MPAFVSACPRQPGGGAGIGSQCVTHRGQVAASTPFPGLAPASGPRAAKETAAAFSAKAAAASGSPQGYYGRVTGPLALMTWWKATGGLACEHLPALLRAPMARMLSWYFPLPVIPA